MSLTLEDAEYIESLMLPGKWTWRQLAAYIYDNRPDIFQALEWGEGMRGNQMAGTELCAIAADALGRDVGNMPFRPPTREELGRDPVGSTYVFEAYANPEEGDEVYISLPDHLSHLLGERLRVTVEILEQPEPKSQSPVVSEQDHPF